MTMMELLSQVGGLEAQLSVLKARLREAHSATQLPSFADLEGILADKAEPTEEDLRAAEHRPSWGGL